MEAALSAKTFSIANLRRMQTCTTTKDRISMIIFSEQMFIYFIFNRIIKLAFDAQINHSEYQIRGVCLLKPLHYLSLDVLRSTPT